MIRVYYKDDAGEVRAMETPHADHKAAIWVAGSHLVLHPRGPQAKGPVLAVINGDKPLKPIIKRPASMPAYFDDEPPKGAA